MREVTPTTVKSKRVIVFGNTTQDYVPMSKESRMHRKEEGGSTWRKKTQETHDARTTCSHLKRSSGGKNSQGTGRKGEDRRNRRREDRKKEGTSEG